MEECFHTFSDRLPWDQGEPRGLDLEHAALLEWSAFSFLPQGLVKLSFAALSSESKPRSLSCFDSLHMLQELSLTFCPAEERDELVVTDDLSLLKLQCFNVRFDYGDIAPYDLYEGYIKIMFADLTLTKVSALCDSVFVVGCSADSRHAPLDVEDVFVLPNVDSYCPWLDVWLDLNDP